jgi:serine/threonine protein kinase
VKEYKSMTESKSLEIKRNSHTLEHSTGPKTKYKLKKEPIGRGSFSTVYFATGPDMCEYAIKRISVAKLQQNRLSKFLLELDISKQMAHDNIVKCHEIFKTPTHWYIVSEYCNYGTFGDLISAIKNVDVKKKENLIHYYLNQLKNALYYLNINNIIHRDLKPMNILLTRTDKTDNEVIVKLADFGFARFFEHNPANTTGYDDMVATVCGSPIYMAPELLINDKYNIKADLWSFGIIMYELLYGTNPYNFPKNIAHLKELMEKKEINFDLCYSNNAIHLMKSLLQINPEKRIGWDDFFNHDWFKTTPYEDEMIPQIDKDPSSENIDDVGFEFDENVERCVEQQKIPTFLNYLEEYLAESKTSPHSPHKKGCQPSMGKPIKSIRSELDMSEFVVVDSENGTETIGPDHPQIHTYQETYTSSIIKIFTDSIGYLWGGQAKSY